MHHGARSTDPRFIHHLKKLPKVFKKKKKKKWHEEVVNDSMRFIGEILKETDRRNLHKDWERNRQKIKKIQRNVEGISIEISKGIYNKISKVICRNNF